MIICFILSQYKQLNLFTFHVCVCLKVWHSGLGSWKLFYLCSYSGKGVVLLFEEQGCAFIDGKRFFDLELMTVVQVLDCLFLFLFFFFFFLNWCVCMYVCKRSACIVHGKIVSSRFFYWNQVDKDFVSGCLEIFFGGWWWFVKLE